MSKHFNKLTPGEAERLALMLEEMAEAQQVIGKILRHGYESRDPTKPDRTTNRKLLEKELGDVAAALDLLLQDLDGQAIARHTADKHRRVRRWLHHQVPGAKS